MLVDSVDDVLDVGCEDMRVNTEDRDRFRESKAEFLLSRRFPTCTLKTKNHIISAKK